MPIWEGIPPLGTSWPVRIPRYCPGALNPWSCLFVDTVCSVHLERLYLVPVEPFDGDAYLVVTPINSSAVTCNVDPSPLPPGFPANFFVVNCWDLDGIPVTAEYYFVMVGR